MSPLEELLRKLAPNEMRKASMQMGETTAFTTLAVIAYMRGPGTREQFLRLAAEVWDSSARLVNGENADKGGGS